MSYLKVFFVNGEEYSTKDDLTLFELLRYFNYNAPLFVLEYNHKICEKKNWDQILIKNKDKIEIVTIVGGG